MKRDIRNKADDLLSNLAVAFLRNISQDNRVEIEKRLDEINKSGIDWSKDVVKSVRESHKHLTSSETVNNHMKRSKDDGFSILNKEV